MSEVQSRSSATRGRGSHRAGRGGLTSRGGGRTSTRHTNGDSKETTTAPSLDEQGEIGQLKKQYGSQLSTLRELFPDWTDDDLVFACQETNGDLPTTVERISDGTVSRFADVKKKERTRPKTKEGGAASNEASTVPTRGRSRAGIEGSRGTRGRTSERGRGPGRGGRSATSTASRSTKPREPETTAWPEAENLVTTSWDETSNPVPDLAKEATSASGWVSVPSAPDGVKSNLVAEVGQKKSWAMIAKPPKPTPAAPKPTRAAPETAVGNELVPPDLGEPPQPEVEGLPNQPSVYVDPGLQIQDIGATDPLVAMATPGDQLTEENLELVLDISGPTPTETLASTRDPRSTVGTPYTQPSASHQPPISRPPMSGYAANAWKAAGITGRAASNPRRIMEQQETVVMPMNHAVDRAAVQFGSMGLNGDEGIGLELDEDREEPETRAQPPQQSPSQPRASLPPVSHQPPVQAEASMPINIGTPKQAPGLPSQIPAGAQGLSQPASLGAQPYAQYNRFGAGSLGQEQTASSQKPDIFHQQTHQQDPASAFPSHSQATTEPQQNQTHLTGLSTGSNDFPSQYGGDHQRSAYQSYYGSSYGQQGGLSQQDTPATSQKASTGFGATPSDSTYASNPVQQSARFGDNQASGHTTPNPTTGTQQSMGAPQPQGQHLPQQHGQAGHSGGYGYGQPYYSNSYYNQYMGQGFPNQYSQYQQNYGGHYGAKNNPYGQPHHGYGSYDHASSPANASGFGGSSVPGRDNAFSSGLNDYTRSGSAQPSQNQAQAASGAGFNNNLPDSLGRSSSGFANQNQQYGQTGLGGSEDSLRPSQDARVSGPSPSYGQPGRPGSAANSAGNTSSQAGYPPSQSQPHGYGGYPNQANPLHSNTGSQFGSLGGLGGHQAGGQSHQGGSYGSYGGGFGNTYGGSYGRGGWGGNYGH